MTTNSIVSNTYNQIELPKNIIRHPRYNELYKCITDCMEESHEDGEPYCMYLEGESGVGKSTVAKECAAKHPPQKTDSGTRVPIFYVSTPSLVTIRGMAMTMLKAIGDPGFDKGTRTAMEARLMGLMNDCEVRLVIMDDFHHLIDSDRDKVILAVAEWLKSLIKDTKIPFLIIGTDHQVNRILESNNQLKRLFPTCETLEPFAWDFEAVETIQDFSNLINYAKHVLEIEFSPQIPYVGLLYKIHLATDGYMSNLMLLLRRAKRINHDSGPICLEVLEQAYTDRVENIIGRPNPFTDVPPLDINLQDSPIVSDLELLDEEDVPVELPPDPPNSTNNRSQRRKNRQTNISSVLTTSL